MAKQVTFVEYHKDGTNYKASLPDVVGRNAIEVAMLKRGIARSQITKVETRKVQVFS